MGISGCARGQHKLPCVMIVDIQTARNRNVAKVMQSQEAYRMVNISRFPSKRNGITHKEPACPMKAEEWSTFW